MNKRFRNKTDKAKQPSNVLRVLSMYSHLKWRIIGLIAIGCVGIVLFALMPMFTRNVFNLLEDSILAGTNPQIRTIYMYLVLFGILALFNEVFQLFAIWMILRYEDQLCKKVMNGFKRKLDVVPMSFLEKYQPGDLAKRVGGLVHGSVRLLLPVTFRVARSIFFFITTAIVMFMINWILAIVVIMSLPICIITARIVSKRTQRLFDRNNSVILETFSFVDQKTQLHEFNKLHGIGGTEEDYEDINDREAKGMMGEEMAVALNTVYVRFIQELMLLVVTVVFGILFISGYLTEFGALPAFLVFSNRFLANAVIVTEATNTIQMINARAPKVFEIMDCPDDLTEGERISIQRIGDIEFNKVSYIEREDVLVKNVSFKIEKGSNVALVGLVGSGKSKIVDLLAKMELPSDGMITMDGVNLNEITRDSYYSRMGIAFEKPFIFKGTVAENILYGVRRAMPERVMNVTKKLGIHDFIEQLPNRYETEVSENSPLLSLSQRQALNVARTVMKASDLVIFHDAHNAADAMAEKEGFENIMAMEDEQTKIFVTHRLSSIVKCDRIFYMERGRIVEQGTHAELMKLKKRYYRAYMSN